MGPVATRCDLMHIDIRSKVLLMPLGGWWGFLAYFICRSDNRWKAAIRDKLLQRPENGNGSRSFWFLATGNHSQMTSFSICWNGRVEKGWFLDRCRDMRPVMDNERSLVNLCQRTRVRTNPKSIKEVPWHSLYKHSLYVTKFIRTFFIQDRIYTGQSLYGTKFIRWQSLYEDKVYTNFFHTALELKDIKWILKTCISYCTIKSYTSM